MLGRFALVAVAFALAVLTIGVPGAQLRPLTGPPRRDDAHDADALFGGFGGE